MIPSGKQTHQREFAFDERDFKFLAALANKRTGIVLAEHKRDMIYGRLARRLRTLGLESFSQYCELLQGGDCEDEMSHLVNAITTNLTSFFREGHHFDHLRESVLAPLAKTSVRKLRLWSSACSSGMEPYSMAMTAHAAIADLSKWDARILATDIDSNMLKIGSLGRYAQSEYEHIPAQYRKYVAQTNTNQLEMNASLKELIRFRQLNLLETWPIKGKFDAVFCRNVVIYFDKPTKQKLFERIADTIVPGGWLYIGHSENLHGISDRFELVGRTIYRRVK